MRIGLPSLALAALGACLGAVFIAGRAPAQESPAGMAARAALQPPVAGWMLKGVVLLSRHGIRGPTVAVDCGPDDGPKGCLDAVGADPWPTLGVAAGHLVPEGYQRVRTLGRFYRLRYAAAGLLPERGCSAASSVSYASDADERTIMTAGAVMDGMFPGCALDDLAIVPEIYRGPACGYDQAAAEVASRQLVGGSWAAVAAGPLAGPLAAMDRIVGPLRPEICRAKGRTSPCSAAQLGATADDPGAIDFLSQPVEQFIMQYGSGIPASEVGWGRIEAATGKPIAAGIAYLNEIHALHDWAGGVPSYQARKRGSPVLALVLRDLEEIAAGNGAVFRFLASHDNYILNVGGMLGLSWRLEGYARYQVPPGGAIAFELWQMPAGPLAARLVYFAQTIEQLHENPPLTLAAPPAAEILPVGGCKADGGGTCAFADFTTIAGQAIEPACVTAGGSAP